MHSAVKAAAERANITDVNGESRNHEGFGALFEDVRPLIEGADIAFANLETPIAPSSVLPISILC